MSYIPLGFGEFVINYSQQGTNRPAQTTIGTRLDSVASIPAYVAGVIDSWNDTGRILSPETFDARLSVVNIRFTYMVSSGPIVIDTPYPATGTRAGDAQPPNVAALIRRVTDRGGRRGRGRAYLPSGYLNEADVAEGGYIVPARITQLQTIATNFYNGVNVLGGVAVLLHNDEGVIPDEIEAMTVQPLVATMRRRLRK